MKLGNSYIICNIQGYYVYYPLNKVLKKRFIIKKTVYNIYQKPYLLFISLV